METTMETTMKIYVAEEFLESGKVIMREYFATESAARIWATGMTRYAISEAEPNKYGRFVWTRTIAEHNEPAKTNF